METCHRQLLNDSPGPLSYLVDGRRLKRETLERERIGHCSPRIALEFSREAPEEWRFDPEYLCKQLSGCIIVPIRDDCGKLLGLAARSADPKVKGWWNTPFAKTECVYGLDHAKAEAYRKNKVYLVEGYIDRLILGQEGLRNTVGIMSTALSKNAVANILRYCDRVCACFDTDIGKNGGEGGGQIGLRNFNDTYNVPGFFGEATAIVLPLTKDEQGAEHGTDPDEFVLENGLVAFLALERYLARRGAWRF